MNIEELDKKLKNIQNSLNIETQKSLEFAERLNDIDFEDNVQESSAKEYYYSQLDEREKIYVKKNDEYKKLISGFSQAYLDFCEWYVGPELPRDHESTLLDSKEDINSLYFLFAMSLFLKS
jgi:hypothetical protein|tara:strand:- start:1447 stop:1809 length:363 start_codon:yes stop_codon:yes gene_type:complete